MGFGIGEFGSRLSDRKIPNPKSEIDTAAIVQGLERQIVVLDVVGSIPTSRPINLFESEISGLSPSEKI